MAKLVYMYMDLQLQIDKNITLRNIQTKFNEAFPYLKLEFKNQKTVKQNEKADLNKPGDTMASYTDAPDLNIDIDGKMTVASLEEIFWKKTGLMIQIFRKCGNIWIETSLTHDWTLEQQNIEGESLSTHSA